MSFNKNEPRQTPPTTPTSKNPQGKPEEKMTDKKHFPDVEANKNDVKKPDAGKTDANRTDTGKTGTDRR